ncbi:hypothetical protein M422DRAFT_246168 [Sphaerobolus stellatus SS14]|nr:hypothetical protein M422DRAFT_246162 [Sphaerobolus stellatus SS14]KIJ49803.1 hypothetical protein M422DRAFT_246168 [Sphaerobolus stellatus SS14]
MAEIRDFIQQNVYRISKILVFGYRREIHAEQLPSVFWTTPFPELITHIFNFRLCSLIPWVNIRPLPLFTGHALKLKHVAWSSNHLPYLPTGPWRNLASLRFTLNLDNGGLYPSWQQVLSLLSLNPDLETLAADIEYAQIFKIKPSPSVVPTKCQLLCCHCAQFDGDPPKYICSQHPGH